MANLFSVNNGKIKFKENFSEDEIKEINSTINKNNLKKLKKSSQQANEKVQKDTQAIGTFLNKNGQNVNINSPFSANIISNKQINESKNKLNGRVTLEKVVQEHNNLMNSEEGQELKNNLRISNNERAWADYNYNQARVNSEKTTLGDKTIGTVTRGVKDLFSNMTDARDVVDENGKTKRLPSYNEMKQQKVSGDYKTGLGKFLGDASYNISKIGASSLMNIPTLGVGGSAIYWGDMYFDSYNSAKNEGYSEDKAFKYALVNTSLEYITGKFLGSATKSLTGGKTSELSNALSNGINKLISDPKISYIIGNAGSEATEEFIQEYLDNLNKLITLEGSKDPKDYIDVLTDKNILKDALYSAGVGALSGGVMSGINSTEANNAINNSNLLETFRNNLVETRDSLTNKNEIAKYNQVISEIDSYISTPFGNESKVQNVLPTVQDLVSKNNTQKFSSQIDNNTITNQTNIPTVQDIVNQERNSKDINLPTRDNINQQNNTYQYQTSGNEKIDNLRKSAVENNFNNSESTINYMNMLEQIITDKNVDILFDPNLKDSQGRMANGKYENGVITINPNSNRAGEFIAIHELTHAIGTDQMKNIIQKYRNSNTEFDTAVQQLLKNYNVDEINEEAMADVAGQLFGNQDFINNLSKTQPSLFRKLYNEIKYLWHQFRGYKNQNEFIEDLQYKWEQAYRSNAGLNNTNSYSVETLKNGKSYVKLEDNIFETEDGLPMSQREIYNSLIGKEIVLNDGIKAKIVNRLPSKNMYNELFKRYPTYQNVKDIKTINNRINENFTELLENSDNISPNEPDYNGRHQKQKINSFDTRKVSFFDGNKAYDLDLSIAQLNDGTYIAYAKKNLKPNNNLLNEIKKERSMSKSQLTSAGNNIPQINKNVKSDTSSTKYSIQESQNNTQELNNSSFSNDIKQQQLDIINKSNPADDEVHTWIRSTDDIKTFEEAFFEDGEYSGMDPDFTEDMANDSLKSGEITVYSSNPIENGTFVSPSQMEASQYAGGDASKLYSKTVNINDVAWIDGAEGQYAKVDNNTKSLITNKDNQGKTLSQNQKKFFKDSKIRDENGNLKVMYHGTKDGSFNIFDRSKAKTTGNFGTGIYFASDKSYSNDYINGKGNSKIYEVYLNITNPLDSTNKIRTLTNEQVRNLVETIAKNEDYGIDNYGYNATIDSVTNDLIQHNNDFEIFQDLDITCVGNFAELVELANKTIGTSFDGINTPLETVAFSSNQIKNVDNLNPTTNDDIRYSKNNKTWQSYLEDNFESKGTKTNFKDILLPTQKDINKINLPTNKDINLRSLEKNNLGYIPQDPTRESSYDDEGLLNFWELDNKKKNLEDSITEFARALDREIEDNTKTPKQIKETNNLKSKVETMWSDFQEKFVNRNYEIDRFAKKSGNKEIMFKGDMLNSVAGETSGDINVAQTDNYGKRIGESLNSLFKNSKKKGYYEQFDDYLKHYSNIDRHAYGKGSVVPLEYSQKMVQAYEQSIPGIKSEATKVWQYGKNLLNNMEENGLISKEFKGTLEELYPHYVPYMQSESMVPYMDDSGEIKPKKVIKRAEGGAHDLVTIEEAFERYTYATKKAIRQNDLYKEIVKTSKEKVSFGADDRVDPTQLDGSLMKDAEGNGYVTAYVDGMQQQAKVSDNLYQELTKDNELKVRQLEEKYSPIVKPLQKISEIRRNVLTTWNPWFTISNPIKDIQDGMFNSKYTTDMIKNYPSAFIELATQNTETAQQFASLYGSGMVMGDYQIDKLSKAAKNMDINQLNKLIKALPNANEIVELAPRYAEFKASLENGCSVTEAMYNARELTTNFNRGGYITKALNRDGFTFLNASVQGFDKLIRNLTGVNGSKGVAVGVAGVMTKVAVLGIAPAMFNAMSFGEGEDDEDEAYKALPDYIKDNYYLFKVKGLGNKNSKYYDGEFLRIPKGRVLSIFGSAARRTLEYSKGDKNAFDGYLKNVDSQIGINNPEENNIIAPIKQAFGSKNGEAWYGGDLVPKRLQNKPAAEQYDEGTDEFSKWLGKMINVSPYKINYLLDQYSGGAGDIVLPMITKETTNGATSVGDYLIAPVKDKFIVNSTDDNKYASKFYTKLETMQIKANGDNVSTSDKLKYKYLSSISSDMSKLYKEKREIQLDDSLSKKEKYKKVQTVQKEINKLAEEGIKEPKIKDVKSHYAKVENTEYYKNSKGSWTTIKDEEASELKSLRMSVNEKSDYFKVKNKIGTIRTSDIESSEKKDKISNLIINMNMSDDKIAYIYGKYYSNEETLDMIQNAGISIKEFIKYNNQSFESEYDSKSNTVKNSKLAKVINYVNTLNLNVAQKAILIKMKYSSYTKYDKQIAEYINSQNLDYLDKATILKKIGFTAYNKQIIKKVNSMDISKEEKLKILKDMGFKVRNGRVYSK